MRKKQVNNMKNGNLEFRKADFMQFRDLEISLEWHIIELKELEENYEIQKVNPRMNIAYMQENAYEYHKASLEGEIRELTKKLFIIRQTIVFCRECVEEKIYLAVSMAVIDGLSYRTISEKIRYSTSQVSRYISQFFINLECHKAFLKAKEEAVKLCPVMKKETNETQSERHET